MDCEAGLEHLSRYRFQEIDLLLIVSTPNPASQAVAQRIRQTVKQSQQTVKQMATVYNQQSVGTGLIEDGLAFFVHPHPQPWSEPVTDLPLNSPLRRSLMSLMVYIWQNCVDSVLNVERTM